MSLSENEPYALSCAIERQRREGMLNQPHIKPLVEYLARIWLEHPDKQLPGFDPCDGGTSARILFLLEAPGPKAVGSTFISRNNPDQTAKNFCELLQVAGIARRDTLIWNIVPWYVGDGKRIRPVVSQDIQQASPYVKELFDMLKNLHPSPQVFNISPEKKVQAQEILFRVAKMLRTT